MRKAIFTAEQIAPCGMNCGVCSGYLALSHAVPPKRGFISHCAGCRARKKRCAYLKGQCQLLAGGRVSFCFECAKFPCKHLEHLDNRYQTRYGMSPIQNLEEIRDKGMRRFVENQTERFLCPKCRTDAVCVHNKKCYRCDAVSSWRD